MEDAAVRKQNQQLWKQESSFTSWKNRFMSSSGVWALLSWGCSSSKLTVVQPTATSHLDNSAPPVTYKTAHLQGRRTSVRQVIQRIEDRRTLRTARPSDPLCLPALACFTRYTPVKWWTQELPSLDDDVICSRGPPVSLDALHANYC